MLSFTSMIAAMLPAAARKGGLSEPLHEYDCVAALLG